MAIIIFCKFKAHKLHDQRIYVNMQIFLAQILLKKSYIDRSYL